MGEVMEVGGPQRASSSARIVPVVHDEAPQQQSPVPFSSRSTPLGLLLLQQHSSRETSDEDFCLPTNTTAAILTIDIPDKFGSHKDHPDDWLPITQSRRGNAFTAAFHLLCSGIGIQALLLPVAFVPLGWAWGTLCLTLVFAWQLYTTWLLVHLHEPGPAGAAGTRCSRYVVLSIIAFGPKLGKLLAIFPTMYLSGGTCVVIIITGGGIMELLYKLICGDDPKCSSDTVLTGAAWFFFVFVCLAILVSQFFPSLHSLAPVSLIGSMALATYFSMLWTLSIREGRPGGVSYEPSKAAASEMPRIRGIINALGIIALTFKGHNLILEIQGTIPTDPQHPSRHGMWRGVTASYLLIAVLLFPLAIGGYWAYGNMMPAKGILNALSTSLKHQRTSKSVMATIYVIMLVHLFSAFQIYGMPVFDNLERIYVSKRNQACPRWVRSAIRVFFGGLTYFIAMAFPFLGSLGPFIGAITLPLTLAYPCFMWLAIKKPKVLSSMWCLNFGLGSLGLVMSFLLAAAALWSLVVDGLDANFFKPH
ncbi:lysine histidine transporter-like 8 [Coffea arabica]|uniref:Lysine histidine transporter-like 8 n=1 Tax=Coffea arabica TaxID=13443 RepID=A0A6P6UC98_COFAR|nr:lysine histidine transporter-like 8 [Coffea arabica]